MAHGFNAMGTKTTFATRKELAWHKLGKVVDAMTSEEAIVLGGMDFEVGLAPLYAGLNPIKSSEIYQEDIGIKHKSKDKIEYLKGGLVTTGKATYRTDTGHIFGTVGNRYEVIQNTEAFEFFDSIIGEGHAEYETVGALGNGERVFLTAKIPSKMLVGKEHIDKYLLLTMSHDGTGSVIIMFTPIRVVCNNTLSAALSHSSNKVSIRHTRNARNRIEDAKSVLGIVQEQSLSLEEAFNAMTRVKLHDQEIAEIVMTSFNMKPDEVTGKFSTKTNNKFNDIIKYHEIGVGQADIRGTGWGVYNAITGYQQNVQSYRTNDSEFESIMNKNSASVRQKAFNQILSLT